jgi:hypothetical protein
MSSVRVGGGVIGRRQAIQENYVVRNLGAFAGS